MHYTIYILSAILFRFGTISADNGPSDVPVVNETLTLPGSLPVEPIVIEFTSDVLEPYSEQVAALGEEGLKNLYPVLPRAGGPGEYCTVPRDCRSRICKDNRCCGSILLQCRQLKCDVRAKQKCYIQDLPCNGPTDCPVEFACDYYNPCLFEKCSAGHVCRLQRSCILPPKAKCVPIAQPCDSVTCPSGYECLEEDGNPTCHTEI